VDHRWVAENWLVDAASVRELPAEEKGVRFFNRARYRSRLSVQRSVVSCLLFYACLGCAAPRTLRWIQTLSRTPRANRTSTRNDPP
jgi:hypothetical protein